MAWLSGAFLLPWLPARSLGLNLGAVSAGESSCCPPCPLLRAGSLCVLPTLGLPRAQRGGAVHARGVPGSCFRPARRVCAHTSCPGLCRRPGPHGRTPPDPGLQRHSPDGLLPRSAPLEMPSSPPQWPRNITGTHGSPTNSRSPRSPLDAPQRQLPGRGDRTSARGVSCRELFPLSRRGSWHLRLHAHVTSTPGTVCAASAAFPKSRGLCAGWAPALLVTRAAGSTPWHTHRPAALRPAGAVSLVQRGFCLPRRGSEACGLGASRGPGLAPRLIV